MHLLNVIMPANARIVYEMLFSVTTFDLVSTDSVVERLDVLLDGFDKSRSHKRSHTDPTIEEYDTTNPMINLILEMAILLSMFLHSCFILALAALVEPHSSKVRN